MAIGLLSRRAVAFAAIAALSVAAPALAQQQMSIATGGTGGVYYPMGGGFANILSKAKPGLSVTAEVTGGSVDNLKLVASKKADIGFSQVDTAFDAYNGLDKFKSGKLPVRAMAVLYPNVMHVVTVDGTGITKLEDLKGKRLSTGSPGSATEVFAFRVLEAAGIDKDKDVKRERLGVAESVNAIKDRKIDAFFWVGGLPTAAVTDLAATPGTKIVMLDSSRVVDKMVEKYGPIYAKGTIPKTMYSGMDADNPMSSVWNIFVVNADASDDDVYFLTKTLFETRTELGNVHKEALNIKEENQGVKFSGIPFHPGALKYFAEKGIKTQ